MAQMLNKNERYGDPTADIAHKREVRRRLQDLNGGPGASGWVTEFTLGAGAGATATVVYAAGVTATSQISFAPTTDEAAALVGKIWVSNLVANSDAQLGNFTVSHPALLAGVVATYRASVKG